jgi:predicted nucleic acid-binding protein
MLDAGLLIAIERGDRQARAWIAKALTLGVALSVPVTVIAELWRGGAHSARVARVLSFCEIDELDAATARRAGELLATTHGCETLDAVLVASAATRHDAVLTGDPDDLRPLAQAAGVRVLVL